MDKMEEFFKNNPQGPTRYREAPPPAASDVGKSQGADTFGADKTDAAVGHERTEKAEKPVLDISYVVAVLICSRTSFEDNIRRGFGDL